jgi:hypothetical protein
VLNWEVTKPVAVSGLILRVVGNATQRGQLEQRRNST